MGEKELVCENVAMEQRMLFDWFRGTEIFTKLYSDNFERLSGFSKIWGGKVEDAAKTDTAGSTLKHWGRYVWYMEGEEAYEFCQAILPYLHKWDPKRRAWCQTCIDTHENRTHPRNSPGRAV